MFRSLLAKEFVGTKGNYLVNTAIGQPDNRCLTTHNPQPPTENPQQITDNTQPTSPKIDNKKMTVNPHKIMDLAKNGC
jgi:hypothetical protein